MAKKNITKKDIEWCKQIIYEAFDKVDKNRYNTDYYKEKFSKMSDEQFIKFASQPFPYRYHDKPFVSNPTLSDISAGLKVLGVPLLEKLNLPHLYSDKDGNPVNTQECLVGYVHLKKMQQFVTKKNSMSTEIAQRDMKTGLLTGHDKNGKSTDREIESLAIMGLEKCMEEFGRPRADAMNSKNVMYNTINSTGRVRLEDLPKDPDDSLSKNLLNTYLIGAHINSNLINQDYMLPYTMKEKKIEIGRK